MFKKIKNVKIDNEQTKIKRKSTIENEEFLLSLTDEEFELVVKCMPELRTKQLLNNK